MSKGGQKYGRSLLRNAHRDEHSFEQLSASDMKLFVGGLLVFCSFVGRGVGVTRKKQQGAVGYSLCGGRRCLEREARGRERGRER